MLKGKSYKIRLKGTVAPDFVGFVYGMHKKLWQRKGTYFSFKKNVSVTRLIFCGNF
jgi:hypothetical protein